MLALFLVLGFIFLAFSLKSSFSAIKRNSPQLEARAFYLGMIASLFVVFGMLTVL